MMDYRRTSMLWALALLMWVLAFALVVVLLARADGASGSDPSSPPNPECAGTRTVRSVEHLVLRAGPPRLQTASAITHLAVGSPTDTNPQPGGPAGRTEIIVSSGEMPGGLCALASR